MLISITTIVIKTHTKLTFYIYYTIKIGQTYQKVSKKILNIV